MDKESTEDQLSHKVHIVERELGVHVGLDYPLIKFWNQYNEIDWYHKEEKKQYEEKEKISTLGK